MDHRRWVGTETREKEKKYKRTNNKEGVRTIRPHNDFDIS